MLWRIHIVDYDINMMLDSIQTLVQKKLAQKIALQ